LYRFAVEQLQFGRTAPTIPILDGEPGQELQVDTGWLGWLTLALLSQRRRFRAWIFTAVFSRYRFVYPTFEVKTPRAIEACEAAWQFFGGVFRVLIADNTKAIIAQPDALTPRIALAFLEYAQARNFHVDAARVRHPPDKAPVERAAPTVRDDCFAGEILATLEDARVHACHWCREEYGLRRHSRTQRPPREHFEAEEQHLLLPAPTTPYDIPLWCTPKVARDQFAQVARAFYSIPHAYIGQFLSARADQQTVLFYDRGVLIKTHPRKPPVGRFAAALLDNPLPWTRMRHVYALLGLARRYGAARVNDACAIALAADMLEVRRLQRMLDQASIPSASASPARLPSRFLRPASQYALPLALRERSSKKGDDRRKKPLDLWEFPLAP
jgi:hypothetical protein